MKEFLREYGDILIPMVFFFSLITLSLVCSLVDKIVSGMCV